jgi:predicted chitinase
MEFKKKDLLVKEDKSEDGIVKKVLGKLEKIKNRVTSEVKETRALVKILAHAVKSYAKNRDFDLNKEDKDFIKGQSTDVIKNVILVLVALIPIPIPLTPFLIIFGKKIGIDLIPKEHDIPEKGKKDKDRLDENNQKIFDDENLNIIEKLCHQSKKRKLKSNTFCRLLDSYNNSNAKEKIITSLQKIFNFFIKDGKGINKGVFPKLVRISLDSNDFTHYLYIISEFLTNSEYEDDDLKIKLKRYKGRDYAPLHLDDIAKQIASKEYTDYEEKLTKDEFGISRTFLSLDYRCEESVDKKIIELLKIIKNLPEDQKHQQFETFLEKFIGCLKQQLDNPKYTIKADAINNLEEPIRYEGETILKKGDYLEIKKMDFEVDSYLSEFFSIFKESKIKYLKKTHILIYNYFVDRVFQWINENGQNYLNTVKNNLAGIIFDNNTFVPIDQIDFYWSNKGQRGCNEKRLSIRFRIKPGLQSVVSYIYEPGKGENSLTQKIIRELPSDIRKKQICTDQLPSDFIIGENKKKQKMNIILTEKQYDYLKKTFKVLNESSLGLQVLNDKGETENYDWLESAEGVLYDYPEYYNTYKDEFEWPIPAVKLQDVEKLNKTFSNSKKGICYNEHPKCYKKALIYGKSSKKYEIDFKQYNFVWNKDTKKGEFVDSGIQMLPAVNVIGYKDKGNKVSNSIKLISDKLKEKGVTDPKVVAAIIAICSKESGFVLEGEETHRGTLSQLRDWFPPLRGMTDQEIEKLRMNQRNFYNKVYGPSSSVGKSIGNIYKNDGYDYRGRGWNGITGRSLYRIVGFERNPDDLNNPKHATTALINYYDKVSNTLFKTYSDDTPMSTIVMDYIRATGGFSPNAMTPFIIKNYDRAYNFLKSNLIKNGKIELPGYTPLDVII